MPPPTFPNSVENQTDLRAVRYAQTKRTPYQASNAKLDAQLSVFRFQPALVQMFTKEPLPLTAKFFQNIAEDENIVFMKSKNTMDDHDPICLIQKSNRLSNNQIMQRIQAAIRPYRHAGSAFATRLQIGKTRNSSSSFKF